MKTDPTHNAETREGLAKRMSDFADELIDPMICQSPAYGAPGYAHCAACCYGTGVIITCDEDQAIYNAVLALHQAADALLPRPQHSDGRSDDADR
jgi:hypothetical protein